MNLIGYKGGFVSLYAMLLVLAISLSGLHVLRSIAIKKELALSLYFQKQSILYALSVKYIALQCLKTASIDICNNDEISFDNNFTAEYVMHKINHAKLGNVILLDISVYANTLLSTHPLQYTRRFILKE